MKIRAASIGVHLKVCANHIMMQSMIDFPLTCRYACQSYHFMDAYYHGLDGKQAAWAAHKYKGHWMMPESVMDDLMKAGL